MEHEIRHDRWIEIESREGTFYIPQALIGKQAQITAEDLGDYCPCRHENVLSCQLVDGYGARLSMPGYSDCTEWTVFPTKDAAEQFLVDTYED